MPSQLMTKDNYTLLCMLSRYLNDHADFIDQESVSQMMFAGVGEELSFSLLLASALGLNLDKAPDMVIYERYFKCMVHLLDEKLYMNNPYLRNISLPEVTLGSCRLKYQSYKPYEAFVCDDFSIGESGEAIPQIGFFNKEFSFPAILQNGRLWMAVIPNEINTMKEAVEAAKGRVLAYGLGLGYYAYMTSQKPEVESVTIVDNSPEIISLFKTYILPQFANREKITVIEDDAFRYAENSMSEGKYDLVFTDLWHDASDGIDLYRKMQSFEPVSTDTQFLYWIEKSLKIYL